MRSVSSGVLDAVEAVGSSDSRTLSVYCLSHLDEVGFGGTRSTSSCQRDTTWVTHLAQFLTPERRHRHCWEVDGRLMGSLLRGLTDM